MSLKCGLLGEKLSHSRSPEIHRRLGNYEYLLYEKTPEEVEDFLLHGDYDVLNVTIPYKRTAFSLCDELSTEAAELGNVNVVVKRFDGKLFGDNTDAFGFEELVNAVGVDVRAKKCVVLGSGGAGATAKAVLEKRGASEVITVSRGGQNNYGNISRHADAALVVNATPVGMYPNCEGKPVELSVFGVCEALIDLIYNPSPTKLMAEAAALGMKCAGGELMLEAQARRASVYMNANIYLYGAPGSGKSTYAKKLAAEKSMPFVDLDSEIERTDGRRISEIFAAEGEASFREKERAALEKVASRHGQVVALGGGALLDPRSQQLAESTGRVVFIECPEEELYRRVALSRDRPLLSDDARSKLADLLSSRREHYLSFSERIRSYD